MRKKVRVYGDEVLRKSAEEVKNIDKNITRLLKNMTDTLKDEHGVGLSAPQVGVLKRVFIAIDSNRNKIITAINPKLVDEKDKEIDVEGCLSFPEIFFSIQRAKKVVLEAFDEKGKKFLIETDGILARCFQHEIDHLNGKLIIDYASDVEKEFWKEKLNNLHKNK